MAEINLSFLVDEIQSIVQDKAFDSAAIANRLNRVQLRIAAGVRMPDGGISPPLPNLYKYDTVTTSINSAWASLPSDYQRNVFKIIDSSGVKITPPRGGDYYAFALFMSQISDLRFTECGSIYKVAVRGTRLYYQGIPAAAGTIGVHYYRKPADMALDGDTPDLIPENDDLQYRLLFHGTCADIFGTAIEDGQDNQGAGYKFHNGKFSEAVMELADYVGIDAGPMHYGQDEFEDAGACDG